METEPRLLVTPRTVVGLTIALVGVALTLDRLGIDQAGRLLRFWPVPLMLVGGLMFVQAQDSRDRFRGAIFAGIGTWLLLNTQGLLSVRIWDLFWPVVLILVGVSLVLQTGRRGSRGARWRRRSRFDPTRFQSGTTEDETQKSDGGPWSGAASDPSASRFMDDSSDRISMFSVMSGVKRSNNSPHFRGGEITAFMGGGKLDLRLATIPPGEEAIIDIVAIMGGVEMWVPSHWEISTPILPFMGGVEDNRLPPLAVDASGARRTGPAPRLVLRGFVMMGGVQIK